MNTQEINIEVKRTLIQWFMERALSIYCNTSNCDECPFGSVNNGTGKRCGHLTDDERLAICQMLSDKEQEGL